MKRFSQKLLFLLLFQIRVGTVYAGEFSPYISNISADSTDNILLVNKSRQALMVLKSPAPGAVAVLDTFSITTGRIPGNKEQEGDMKTPEGIYTIIAQIPGRQLPELYGPLALVLDYPNLVDRMQDRKGSNIWIHGRNEQIMDYQTKGCVSLDNSNILHLAQYITLEHTKVIILDSLVHSPGYNTPLEALISDWISAWQAGDIAQYGQYYHANIQAGRFRNRSPYLRYKQYLEEKYPWKRVECDNLIALNSDYETHVTFTQKYLCPTFHSSGRKELILIREAGEPRIISESFTPTSPQIIIADQLRKFLKAWESAWEDRDIDFYIAFYDTALHADGHDLEQWYRYKKNLFARTANIRVEVSDIDISSSVPYHWRIAFQQVYRSDNYHDVGRKTLIIQGNPEKYESYKIISETWQALE